MTEVHLDFGIIIPARFGSSRLPGKLLLPVGGKPMIVRVHDNAVRAGARFVWIATDDQRIAEVAESAGASVVMTRSDHPTGTDRLAEVVDHLALADNAIIVNVQGDEPMLDPEHVRRVAGALQAHPEAGIATMAAPISDPRELFDPNAVKVVLDGRSMAMMFSRAPLPWLRGRFDLTNVPSPLPEHHPFLRHIGLYAYTARTLRTLASTPPVALELAESLEQLRALWLGIPIHVTVTHDRPAQGIDTEADLERVSALFAQVAASAPAP